jgi:ATP-dependent helicase HrpA
VSPSDITFPDALPVSARREEIARAFLAHQVIVVCGETGSGKTTQLPKIALAAGRAAQGRLIGHTQPRRIARLARWSATRCGSRIACWRLPASS